MVGKIVEYSRSLEGNPRVTFEVDALDELRGLEGELEIKASRIRNKRSLNANAYFHVLVGKIADKMRISKPMAKNILLGNYGQREIMEDGPLIISIISTVDMLEREDIHCKCIGTGEIHGKKFNHWAIIKPSHEYNTQEMAALIDGTVEEAKDLGIETLSENEIKRMEAAWKMNGNRL